MMQANIETPTKATVAAAALRTVGSASKVQESPLKPYAEKWVAQTFYGTMLKQMRNSPFKSELFAGGRGGEVFGSLFDQHLADRMASGVGQQLVHAIVRKLEAQAAYRKNTVAPVDDVKRAAEESANPTRKTNGSLNDVRKHVAPALRA